MIATLSKRAALLAALPFLALAGSCAPPPVESIPIKPTGEAIVVLVSVDGFRADWLDRTGATTLRRFAARGTRAAMMPVFPTKTAPNHYSLVTGLAPVEHGIVGNHFRDPALGDFTLGDQADMRDPRWWGGEPIWIAAERKGLRSATLFWPGSEVPHDGKRASDWLPYNPTMPVNARVDTVLAWLARPAETRPRFVALYFSQVDDAAHAWGSASPQVDQAIGVVDAALATLARGVDSLGLRGQVNLVLVSDHGMTDTSLERVVYLDSLLPLDRVALGDTDPVAMIYPVPGGPGADSIVRLLRQHPRLSVYTRENWPRHWRLEPTPRVPPVLAVAQEGWSIMTTEEARVARMGGERRLRGIHGYDNALPSMQALFLAAGPAFETGTTLAPMSALDVYPLLAHLLQVDPAPGDSALLPFKGGLR